MNTKQFKERDHSLDALGGLLIIFVIFRHCLCADGTIDSTLEGLCYYPLLFYMAWFFFKGGMFYHGKSLSQTIVKSVERLGIPYLVFTLLAIVVGISLYGILAGIDGVRQFLAGIPVHLKREGAVEFNAPLWFIFSLFFVRIFYAFSHEIHIPSYVISVISLLCAWGLYRASLPIGVYFENIALGLFFFSLGDLMKDVQYNKYVLWASLLYYVIYLTYCLIDKQVIGEFIINTHTPYLPTVIYYIAGIVVFDNLFRSFTKLQAKFLISIGEDSIVYYTSHFIILSSVLLLNDYVFGLNNVCRFIVLIISMVILLPLIAKLFSVPKFKWMTGNDISLKISISRTISLLLTGFIALVMSGYVILYLIRLA